MGNGAGDTQEDGMQYGNNKYTLSTGRRLYANNGILGLYPNSVSDPSDSRLTQGSDGEIYEGAPMVAGGRDYLTIAERHEVAEHMIRQWAEWGRIEISPGALACF